MVDLEDFLNNAKILSGMSKNPYKMTYEEFVDFMNYLRKKVLPLKKPIRDSKTFISKEEYMKYYGAISLDDYIKKSHGKY